MGESHIFEMHMQECLEQTEVIDANTATAQICYAMSDMCFLYPITPCLSSY